jgi:hypothetical protein
MLDDSDPCPRCQLLIGDHTLRQMRACRPSKDLDLPFEESHRTEAEIETAMAGGLIVRAAVLDSPLGKVPALVFRFVKGDGLATFPDVTLVGDAAMMQKTTSLIATAAQTAIRASS